MTIQQTQGAGHGSAEPYNKGSDRGSIASAKLIGPHVAAAGVIDNTNASFTAGASAATVTFPAPLSFSKTNYVVMLTAVAPSNTNNSVNITTLTDSSANKFASFVVSTGSAVTAVHWAVVEVSSVSFGA